MLHDQDRQIKRLSFITARIHEEGAKLACCSGSQLMAMTERFRNRLGKGETLDEMLAEAYAVVREAAGRVLSMRHYDVQLMGGIALHEGCIMEMQTGEGKTLASALPVYLNALTGKGVHVVTANEYLASRDCSLLEPLYRYLGLTAATILQGMSLEGKRRAYACDITFGTASEFGFDYLRDNLAVHAGLTVQRPFSFVVIDEVDSILIDEARTPLVISGRGGQSRESYIRVNSFVERLQPERDYTLDARQRTIALTDTGVSLAESAFGVDNLFGTDHVLLYHHILQALRAHHLIRLNVDYCVRDGEINLIDEYTGRIMNGRQYSDGLHQAIEAKEGIRVRNDSQTQASITLQHYFRLYPKLAGMTGTARTEEEEFKRMYGLDTISIPTNRPSIRQDWPDLVYKTEQAKYEAVAEEIHRCYVRSQPVLAGTVSVERSEMLSSLLKERNIPHQVLNANHLEREAEIISRAGQRGAVTISTNMAGRGTDILLGKGADALGGLHVIGTERHESRRIDNQLRGRAGRQGDPGSSRFYLSLEDSLLRRFASESMISKLERLGFDEHTCLEGRHITKVIASAQRVVEASHANALLSLIQYDLVLSSQRSLIYRDRNRLLASEHPEGMVTDMISSAVKRLVHKWCPDTEVPEEWPLEALAADASRLVSEADALNEADLQGMEIPELIAFIASRYMDLYMNKCRHLGTAVMQRLVEAITLKTVDCKWMEHMDAMEQLREGIHLRAYSGENPLREYQVEGHRMFLDMVDSVGEVVVRTILQTRIDASLEAAAI